MKTYTLRTELAIARPISDVFEFFSRAENLESITPPWLHFRILTPLPIQMKQGATISYTLRLRGIPIKWLTEIEHWNPPFEFVDSQVKGPYRRWRHTHRFTEFAGGTLIQDTVDYALPYGLIGRLAHRLQVSRDLARIFAYRSGRVKEILEA